MITAKNQISFTQNGIVNKQNSIDIQNANKLLDDLNSDGVITPFEKQQLDNEFKNLIPEYNSLVSQCNTYSLTAEADYKDFQTAYTTLNNLLYKNSDAPLLDMATTSEIDVATIRNAFVTYYSKRDTVNSLINSTINEKADTALSAVNTKTSTFTQQTQPTALATNDIWYKTDSTGKIIGVYVWNGTDWILRLLDYNALSVGKLSALTSDLGDVTAGTINGVSMHGGDITIGDLQPANGFSDAPFYPLVIDERGCLTSGGGATKINANGKIEAYTLYLGDLSTGEAGSFKAVTSPYDATGYFSELSISESGVQHSFEDKTTTSQTDLDTDGVKVFTGNLSQEITGQITKPKTTKYSSDGIYSDTSSPDADRIQPLAQFTFDGASKYSFTNLISATGFNTEQAGGTVYLGANSVNVGGIFDSTVTGMEHVSIGTGTVYAPRVNTDSLYIEGKKFKVDSGTVSIAGGSGTATSTTIAFNKTFSSAPKVMVTAVTKVPGTTVLGVGTNNVAVDGCEIYVTRSNTTNTIIDWIAIGS